MNKGKLYLIPTPLGEAALLSELFPPFNLDILNSINHYVVEDEKTARRNLRKMGIKKPIAELSFSSLNEHTNLTEIKNYLAPLLNGENIGILSDAGCPGVADPGASLVKLAHTQGIQVIPLVGPSSILLALMASGLNGQSFTFNGYLPKEQQLRTAKIKELERVAIKHNQTQLFIETPYRNNHILDDVIAHCSATTLLCIACNIGEPNAFIKTAPVAHWKNNKIDLSKKPTIFLLGV